MIRRSLRPWQRVRLRHAAFTLIELLTVIAIILVLSALLLNVAGHAQYKSALTRATGEIQQMSTGLESYKVDNGTYPRNGDTDKLNPQSDFAPSSNPNTLYTTSGGYLFRELSGTSFANPAPSPLPRAYITFLPSQLSTGSNAQSAASTWIIDPFGLPYGYSTANAKAIEDAQTSGQAPATDKGYNPTFDLWSTAGYVPNGSGGKSYPTGTATNASGYTPLWIKNW